MSIHNIVLLGFGAGSRIVTLGFASSQMVVGRTISLRSRADNVVSLRSRSNATISLRSRSDTVIRLRSS